MSVDNDAYLCRHVFTLRMQNYVTNEDCEDLVVKLSIEITQIMPFLSWLCFMFKMQKPDHLPSELNRGLPDLVPRTRLET